MSRGHDRERAVREIYRTRGWWVVRAAGSLGDVDVLALKDGERPLMIEVKSNKGNPFMHFRPKDRAELRAAAAVAGADALLCHWPPYRDPAWLKPEEWPA